MGASLANIDRADRVVERFLGQCGLAVDVFAVRILLREAVLNAVVHGSASDPSREVTVELAADPDGVVLTVGDSGPGFDWSSGISSVGFDDDGDRGRGIALMRIYASKMLYNQAGNCVTLRRDVAKPAGHVEV